MKYSKVALAILVSASVSMQVNASELSERAELKQEIKKELMQEFAEDQKSKEPAIKIGGAVRFNYGIKDFDEDQKDRGGDFDFDNFRLDVNGSIGDVTVSAQYRWYQYMDVVHHAYIGYQFSENWEGQLGITQLPFGNMDYNSNSNFFSTNFYVGLEDDYDAGVKFNGRYDKHDIRIAFFKSDELGGIDGVAGPDRYSVDILGTATAGDTPGAPNAGEGLADESTFVLRYSYHFDNVEVGASLLSGDIEGATGNAGSNTAYAFHVKSQIDNIGIMFQYTDYEYDLDDSSDLVTVGSYGGYEFIPASASIYNLNLSYSLDVEIGPITNLTFYNDVNLMNNKSGGLQEDSFMNVTGFAITAGGVYTYVDYGYGKNHSGLGGSFNGESTDYNGRLNLNIGYYF